MTHRVGHCYNNVIQGHCCITGHSSTNNVAPGHHCALGNSCTNVILADYCMRSLGLQRCATTGPNNGTSGPTAAKMPHTDRYKWAHRVFFAHVTERRTPNTLEK